MCINTNCITIWQMNEKRSVKEEKQKYLWCAIVTELSIKTTSKLTYTGLKHNRCGFYIIRYDIGLYVTVRSLYNLQLFKMRSKNGG